MTLPPEELARLRELAKAATPGTWCVDDRGGGWYLVKSPSRSCSLVRECCESCVEEDARFIAAANPETVLALLDEVERLRAENEKLRAYAPHPFDESLPTYASMVARLAEAEGEIDALRAENAGAAKDPKP